MRCTDMQAKKSLSVRIPGLNAEHECLRLENLGHVTFKHRMQYSREIFWIPAPERPDLGSRVGRKTS